MMSSKANINELFERRLIYPDPDIQERLSRLVGLDDYKDRIAKILSILLNPNDLNEWVKQFHPKTGTDIAKTLRRSPLLVFAGDVGSGKTELAETIGDAVARKQKGIQITLFPLSLSTRGQGRVGEMTQLITSAFEYVFSEAEKLKGASLKMRGAIILLVDEADSLAQSRESSQMHHEDRAGVNAFIRGVDRLSSNDLPAAVIMCTNRLTALDPAVKRRATDIFIFRRPNKLQRLAVLKGPLLQLGLSLEDINAIVEVTGKKNSQKYGFTFSDLVQRLVPEIILDAYPSRAVSAQRALKVAQQMVPSPPFKEDLL